MTIETLEVTLAERGKRYGEFKDHASVTQSLKRVMQGHLAPARSYRKTRAWELLEDHHREALEMIVHKIGCILNGDPNYSDSWHDIAGYAKLVEDRCQK